MSAVQLQIYNPITRKYEDAQGEGGAIRVVVESGGGGGGDASAANQATQISLASDQLAELYGLSKEATSLLIKSAIEANGGKLDSIDTRVAGLVTQTKAQEILGELTAQGLTHDSTLAQLVLLVAQTNGVATNSAVLEVRDAIVALGDGATIADLFTVLTNLDTKAATDALAQAGIAADAQLTRLSTQAIESDADATRIATQSIATSIASQATAAKQDLAKAVLDTMSSNIGTLVTQTDEIEPRMIDGSQRTKVTDGTNNAAVTNTTPSGSAYGLVVRPVGGGDASAANQTTGNNSLASVDGKLPTLSGNRVPVETVEKSFATFFATSGNVALVIAGQSMLSLALATPSTVGALRIRDIRIRSTQQTNIAGVIAFFELRRFATHSAGTVVSANKPDSVDALSGDVTIRKGAVISGEEASTFDPQWIMSTDEYGVGTIELESEQVALSATGNMIPDGDGLRLPTIRPGEGINVKLISPAAPPGTFEVTFLFTQE
jgi:predicted aconitase with swiveling domain